jgi:hypothetical protein
MLTNLYGYTLLSLLIITIIVAIISFGTDENGSEYPFAELYIPEVKTRCIKMYKIVVIMFFIQFSFNIIATLLPSTGQTIAIITAGKGFKSETFEALKELDPTIAQYLRNEAKKVFGETVKEITSDDSR